MSAVDRLGWIDGARPERPGEALDRARLLPLLRERLGLGDDAPIEVLQFPGGHSNLTYLLRAGERELVLRRPPFGSEVKGAHDVGREHDLLARLAPGFALAPRPLLRCDDPAILGAPFYVMERIRGVILRRRPPAGLELDERAAAGLADAFVAALTALHALDLTALGLGGLGRPEGYVARQVGGWAGRYRAACADEVPAIERVIVWLEGHMPRSPPPALIHNDFKYDNLVFDPEDLTRVIGILDWEMATQGDPLMDLGTALAYWTQADDPPELQALAFGPTAIPGSPTRQELAERYAARSGRDLEDLIFYYVFGLFKTAVVALQIYARYARGLTQDPRFAIMLPAARALADQAERHLGARSLRAGERG